MWGIRIGIAALLLVAVFNKIDSARILVAGDSMLSHPVLLLAAIAIESFAIGFLLLSKPKHAWWVAFSLFALFTPIATWAWFSKTDCGCFGKPELSWLSLPMDLFVLILLLMTRRFWRNECLDSLHVSSKFNLELLSKNSHIRSNEMAFATIGNAAVEASDNAPSRGERMMEGYPERYEDSLISESRKGFSALSQRTVLGLCCCAAVVGLGLGYFSLNKSAAEDTIPFLLADELTGKVWPRLEQYEPQLKVLRQGDWLVLVVRGDCEHCQSLVGSLGHRNLEELPFRVLTLVAGGNKWPIVFDRFAIDVVAEHYIDWGTHSEPFVASPAVFKIQNGSVVGAQDGENADSFVMAAMKVEK